MKITDIKIIPASRFLYVQIFTNEGIVGVGESGAWGIQTAAAAAIATFKEYLLDKDPLEIEHHWQYMYRFSHFRGAAIMGAISAIDIALWDIAGKYYNAPIWQLLGGKCRDKVRVYNHIAAQTEDDLVEACIKGKEEGFTALGHLNPFLDEPRNQPYNETTSGMICKAERRVAKCREAVGENIDLCLEMHRRLDPGVAIALSAKLEKYNPMFLEDPVRPDNFDAMATVAARTHIPIATGERLHNIFEFEMLLKRSAVTYIRASVCLCGGISGAKKIAALAEANYCSLIPHNPLSPISTNACLQIATAIDNLAIMEYPDPYVASAADKFQANKSSLRQMDMVDFIPVLNNGYLEIPKGPGLGISLIPNVEKKFPFNPHKVATRLNSDGSICDQ